MMICSNKFDRSLVTVCDDFVLLSRNTTKSFKILWENDYFPFMLVLYRNSLLINVLGNILDLFSKCLLDILRQT